MKIKCITFFLILTISFFSIAINATEKNDSIVQHGHYQFRAKDLILPGSMVAIGASTFFFSPMDKLDNSVQKEIQKMRGNHHRIKLDEYLRYVPTAINLTLLARDFLSDMKSQGNPIDGLTDKVLSTGTSIVTMYVLTEGLKQIVGRERPDGSDKKSFPSGHTASVFLSAESLRMSYGNWWGFAGYTAATATAFLRLYNNRHWFSDVIAGAGIGILSARVGDWLLPFERHILGLDKKNNSDIDIVALPTYNSIYNSFGMTMAIRF